MDGYVAGPDDGPGKGLGEGGERLHYWVFGGAVDVRRRARGEATGEDAEWLEEGVSQVGAVVGGRWTYEAADHWGGENPWGHPDLHRDAPARGGAGGPGVHVRLGVDAADVAEASDVETCVERVRLPAVLLVDDDEARICSAAVDRAHGLRREDVPDEHVYGSSWNASTSCSRVPSTEPSLTAITSNSGYSSPSSESTVETIAVSSLYAATMTLTGMVKRDSPSTSKSWLACSCLRTTFSTNATTTSAT